MDTMILTPYFQSGFCTILLYHLVIKHSNGKSCMNGGFNRTSTDFYGPFSIAMFDYRRVFFCLEGAEASAQMWSRKEAALNRFISEHHQNCDLDHTQVQPHQQRALLGRNGTRSDGRMDGPDEVRGI